MVSSHCGLPKSDSSSSSSSSSGDSNTIRVVPGSKAKVISKKASKKGIHTHKTYLEATSPSTSDDSHLSWEDYNQKASQAGKLTRSRSWDGIIDCRI